MAQKDVTKDYFGHYGAHSNPTTNMAQDAQEQQEPIGTTYLNDQIADHIDDVVRAVQVNTSG